MMIQKLAEYGGRSLFLKYFNQNYFLTSKLADYDPAGCLHAHVEKVSVSKSAAAG
jgi:hypothetical protein